jgi:hypothetical protein
VPFAVSQVGVEVVVVFEVEEVAEGGAALLAGNVLSEAAVGGNDSLLLALLSLLQFTASVSVAGGTSST